MSKKKKVVLILIGILLCVICAFLFKEVVFAKGLFGEETKGTYSFNKYPIENYRLDSYVDTADNWMPGNWGKAISDGTYSLLAFLQANAYQSMFFTFYVIGYVIQAVYSTDVIQPLIETTVNFVQGISGFNGGFTQNGIFTQFFATVVIIAGLYYAFLILKKETGKTISGMATFCLLIVVSLGFFMRANYFIGGANDIANSVQTIVLKAGTGALGMDADPGIAVRDGFFDVTVYQPYLLLQYNDTSISKERAGKILSLESGGEEREKLVKEEVEKHDNKMMNGWYGYTLREADKNLLLISGYILAGIIIIMVGVNLYHQFVFLFYVCISPFVLILSLLPGRAFMAVKLGGKILYELCMRIMIAMLLCLMYVFSSVVFKIVGAEGYIIGAVIQVILYIGIFVFRKKIFSLFINKEKQGREFSLGKVLGTFMVANRGLKVLSGIMGADNKAGLVRRIRAKSQSNANISPSRVPRNTPKLAGVSRQGLLEKAGSYMNGKDDDRDIETKNSSEQRPNRKQLFTHKKQNNANRYRPVVPINRPNANFSKSDFSKYRRKEKPRKNLATVSTTSSHLRSARRSPVNVSRYKPTQKENIPVVRENNWKGSRQKSEDNLKVDLVRKNSSIKERGANLEDNRKTDSKANEIKTTQKPLKPFVRRNERSRGQGDRLNLQKRRRR